MICYYSNEIGNSDLILSRVFLMSIHFVRTIFILYLILNTPKLFFIKLKKINFNFIII